MAKQKHPTAAGEREYENSQQSLHYPFSGHVKPWSKRILKGQRRNIEKYMPG